MKKTNTKWKAAIGIILTMILTLMLLTIIYWLFIEQQIETRSRRVLVMVGMIYGGMYLHRVLIKRHTCWWDTLTGEKRKNQTE